jgi:hypothetical protein
MPNTRTDPGGYILGPYGPIYVAPGNEPPGAQFVAGPGGAPQTRVSSVPLNAMNLPVGGPSQEARDAAFARQNAELQARIARRANALARGENPDAFSIAVS